MQLSSARQPRAFTLIELLVVIAIIGVLDLLSAHELSALRKVPLPDNVRTNFTLFNNAALVKLGVADTNRIDIKRLP